MIEILSHKIKEQKSNFIICICPDNHNSSIYETDLSSSLNKISGLKVIHPNDFFSLCPASDFFDDYSLNLAHIPYSKKGFIAIGTVISRYIHASLQLPYKVIVLDCDNTLWNGICGEVSIQEILISHEYQCLQSFFLAKQQEGFVICLASKNYEDDVLNVFKNHPRMILKLENITLYKINWNSKSENLREISKELGLGLDTFIFIDDNPVECAEVKSKHPQVLTLQLPENKNQFSTFLKNIWAFDRLHITSEDLKRTEMYQNESKRIKLRKENLNFHDFIQNLQINITIHPMTLDELPRVSQLTFRTNQFNFTTQRRNESELQTMISNHFYIDTVSVCDKFGNYGLVGVMIYSLNNNELYLDTFLLSCRVLGRGVEYEMLSFLAKKALKEKKEYLKIEFRETLKNKPARLFLNSLLNEEIIFDNDVFIFESKKLAFLTFKPDKFISPEPLIESSNVEENVIKEFKTEKIQEFLNLTTRLITIDSIEKEIESRFQKSLNQNNNYNASINDLQNDLVKQWEYVLNISPIGIQDSFFSLGGDSLKAIELISLIAKELFIDITPKELFQNPTIESLSQHITEKKENFYPFSFPQEALWLSHEIQKEKSFYNVPLAFKITGNFNIVYFENALNEIFKRHEIFRINLQKNDGNLPVNSINEFSYISLKKYTIGKNENINKIIDEESWKPFDLYNDFLYRISLFEINKNNYIFLIVFHHLMIDESSLSIFFKELNTIYNSCLTGNKKTFPNSPIQYKEFASMQNKALVDDKTISFWKKQLKDTSLTLKLPTDFLKINYQTKKINHFTYTISKDILDSLSLMAIDQKTTFYTFLLSSFLIVLHRHTGDNDILIGSPISHRNLTVFKDTIGLFASMVPIRADFSTQKTFIEFLEEIKNYLLDVYENLGISFNKILECSNKKMDINHALQTIFLIRNKHEILNLTDLSIERIHLYNKFSAFDITFIAEVFSEKLLLHVEYSSELFKEDSIKRMCHAFEELLKSILKNPLSYIGDFSLITEEETQKFQEWNNTDTAAFYEECLQHLFLKQVENNPKAIALIGDKVSLSYDELKQRANGVNSLLSTFKLNSGSIVAICIPRDEDFVSSIFGVLQSGSTFILLDPFYPETYLLNLLHLTNADVLLVHTTLKNKFRNYDGKILVLNPNNIEKKEDNSFLLKISSPNDIAYIIFTSGSTGVPKGVRIEHRSVCNMVQALSKKFEVNENSRFLQFSSPSFDAIIFEIFATLLAGGTLVLLSSENRLNPIKLDQIIEKFSVNILSVTPSFLKASESLKLIGVKTLIVAGELNQQSIIDRWSQKLKLFNAYGPTEATVCATVYQYDHSIYDFPNNIGKPINNVKTYILDQYLKPVSIGLMGELYLAGCGIARDYLNFQENNESNPFSIHKNDKIYKTGDLACFSKEGNIHFLGRKDNQIKLNGFRIELSQIESTLENLPNVKQAVVLIQDQSSLVAYLTLKKTAHEDKERIIQESLSQVLPHYMIPHRFIFLDSLPYLNNGKVDRNKLSKISVNKDTTYIPPKNFLELKILEIWEEVLDKKYIGINDNLFFLGGSSIHLIQIISKVHQYFNITIDVNRFYLNPTVSEIISQINKDEKKCLELFEIQSNGKESPLFLVHPSMGLAFPYLPLKDCDLNRPIYAFNNPYFGRNHFSCLKQMASHYINIIRQTRPKGPYTLGGWSFGGTVALEIAQQLKNQGETIDLVLLIDSHINIRDQKINYDQIFHDQCLDLDSHFGKYVISEIENNSFLLKNYKPTSYHGKVILLKASEEKNIYECNGWSPYLESHLDIYPIKGRHATLFHKENITELIDSLNKVFKK